VKPHSVLNAKARDGRPRRNKHRLRRSSEADWERYEAYLVQHPTFELEAVRGYERVVEVVAARLRAYVKKHPFSVA
jgi:hypothetical protein